MKAPTITLHNADCLPAMRGIADGRFELAIVDPPYGMKASDLIPGSDISSSGVRRKQKDQRIKETIAGIKPSDEYWLELKRVSSNQIVWGWNHYGLAGWGPGRIVWVKNNPVLSGAEIAYNSVRDGTYVFTYTWSGFCMSGEHTTRTHPTQKPVALYKWLLRNYAKPGDTILDTHLGSGSIAIACHDYGFDLVGYELDKDYYDAAVLRLDNHRAQMKLDLWPS